MTLKLVAAWPALAVWPVAAWIGLLPISVTLPVYSLPGSASMVTLADLAESHRRDVGLVDLDFRFDDRHVGDRQQHRAGVVHRADDDGFALLDVAAGDDAVDRRLDAGATQVVLRLVQRGAFLADALILGLDVLLALAQFRLADVHGVLRPVELLPRGQLLRPQLLLALELAAREREVLARRDDREPLLLEHRPRRQLTGLARLHGRGQVARVDLHQELAALDAVAFLHRQLGHAAHVVGADVDGPLGLDLPRGRHDRRQIPGLHGFHRDFLAGLLAIREVGVGQAGHDRQHHDGPQPPLGRTFHLPPKTALMAATARPMRTYTTNNPPATDVHLRR